MSQGPRIPHARALAAAEVLFKQWRMSAHECLVAGSVRRGLSHVGDLDLTAPLPIEGGSDALFEAIDATAEHGGSLFPPEQPPFTKVLSGLKPHFKIACLVVQLSGVLEGRETEPAAIPVQIHRYTPDNRGWVDLMKTGPTEFNIWFLSRWKDRFQIHPKVSAGNPEGNALIDNHLVDPWGKIIPVGNEQDCFVKLGIAYIPPEQRTAHPGVARAEDRRERDRVMR